MSLTYFYDPLDEFDDIFNDFRMIPHRRRSERTGPNQNVAARPFVPKMDVKELPDTNQVQATIDLPGLGKENINIDVHNDRLTVSGETESSSESKGEAGYSVRERSYGKFSRSLTLPRGTKPEEVKANMVNGVLTLTFPKTAPEHAPARITIN